jgi:hypothetical protein
MSPGAETLHWDGVEESETVTAFPLDSHRLLCDSAAGPDSRNFGLEVWEQVGGAVAVG